MGFPFGWSVVRLCCWLEAQDVARIRRSPKAEEPYYDTCSSSLSFGILAASTLALRGGAGACSDPGGPENTNPETLGSRLGLLEIWTGFRDFTLSCFSTSDKHMCFLDACFHFILCA